MPYRLIHDGQGTIIGMFEAGKNTKTYTKYNLVEKSTEDDCLTELVKLAPKEIYIDSVKYQIVDEAPALTKDQTAVKLLPERWEVLEGGKVKVAYEVKAKEAALDPVGM